MTLTEQALAMPKEHLSDLAPAPEDAIFGVVSKFRADPAAGKVNLAIGAYRDDKGLPVVFDAVKVAGRMIYAPDSPYDKEYNPMGGSTAFLKAAAALLFTPEWMAESGNRVAAVQTCSGTGAIQIIGSFLKNILPPETCVYYSDPTWPNHIHMFGEGLKFAKVLPYPYWCPETRRPRVAAMCAALEAAPKGSVVILQACAHNPTGADPTHEEWQRILDVCRSRNHFVLLDSAYQGFATTDFDRDAYSLRLFARSGLSFAVSQSFAKNMGLYGERTGAAYIVCGQPEVAEVVRGKMERLCRLIWSNPPKHGGELATMVMNDPTLRAQWLNQVTAISGRLHAMRLALKKELDELQTPGNWDHIVSQIGMFSYTGLTPAQVASLIQDHHIYLPKSGRISLCGVNSANVAQIAKSIDAVVRKTAEA